MMQNYFSRLKIDKKIGAVITLRLQTKSAIMTLHCKSTTKKLNYAKYNKCNRPH
jgi:hypothetical protein